MKLPQKLKHELRSIALATVFFAAWLGILMGIKILILEDYHIHFSGFSAVLLGALILAKVVLILEHVPLGRGIEKQPVWVNVVMRTLLYGIGTFVVMLLEKAFEARHEYGGFGASVQNIFQHRDMPHLWANSICVTGALFFYNLLSVLNRHLGTGGLLSVFLAPSKTHKD